MSERPENPGDTRQQQKAQDRRSVLSFVRAHGAEVVDTLTLRDSSFTARDLVDALGEQPEDTLPAHLHRLAAAQIQRSAKLVTRLGDGSLTSTSLLADEKALDKAARRLAAQKAPLVTPAAYRKAMLALDKHYKDQKRAPDPSYTAGFKQMLSPGALKLLEGPPGGQKSRMMRMLIEARRQSDADGNPRTLVTAESDRVTSTLAENAQCPGQVLEAVIAAFDKGVSPLEAGGLLIVDEAAMLGTRRMARLLQGAAKHDLNVVMLGDSLQIPPQLAGHPFRYLTKTAPTATLDNTFRQRKADERQATVDLRNGDAAAAVAVYADKGRINFSDKRKDTLQATVDAYVDRRVKKLHSPRSMLMVGMTEQDASRMNKWVREDLIAANVIGASQPVTVTGGNTLPLSMGDRILFDATITPPGHDRPVTAGSAGFVSRITGKWVDIVLDGTNPRAMRLSREDELPLSHGYATDLRRGQGLKADHTYIAVTEALEPGAGLVAFSRHKRSARFFLSQETYPTLEAFTKDLGIRPHKAMALDAPAAPTKGPDTPKADRRSILHFP